MPAGGARFRKRHICLRSRWYSALVSLDHLPQADPEIYRLVRAEEAYQAHTVQLIPSASDRRSSSPAQQPTRGSSTSRPSARSPGKSAPTSSPTSPTLPVSSSPAPTLTPRHTPTSSRLPPTRPSAAHGAQ